MRAFLIVSVIVCSVSAGLLPDGVIDGARRGALLGGFVGGIAVLVGALAGRAGRVALRATAAGPLLGQGWWVFAAAGAAGGFVVGGLVGFLH